MSDLIAKESGHWYDPKTGEPVFSVTGAKGQTVSPDIRHARKLGLVPGVTAILGLLDKPGLTEWKINQAIMASLTLPRHGGETETEFVERVRFDSKEQGKKAAERGTALHAAIELFAQGKPYDSEFEPHIIAVIAAIGPLKNSAAEKTFAHPLGFGGKIDLSNPLGVWDIKSKDKIEDGKRLAWDEHQLQLSAYRAGLNLGAVPAWNVFVGIEDCKVAVHEWTPGELDKGWEMFKHLLAFYKLRKGL